MADRADPGQRARAIFERAIELDGVERERYVEAHCGSDVDLEREVHSLLGWHAAGADFLESPPVPASERALDLDRDPSTLAEGSWLGPYRLLEVVGRGGMGVVYRAEQHEPLRRDVAIKVLRRELAGGEAQARFDAECRALALMRHPGVAAVLDRGTTPTGLPYLVMELVSGEPITAYCERRGLALGRRLELFALVCEAIQHAHQKGVIHRDIKGSNLLVEGEGPAARPRVLDFGVAKGVDGALRGEEEVTRAGEVIGTPEYMSPEQLGQGAGDVDTRSDVYSLGVLLYRLVAGELPFESDRLRNAPLAELQRLVCEVDPPRPSGRRPSLPEDLDWIVLKCLEKDRDRRYASAADLASDVRRFLAHEPVLAGRATTRYRIGKFVRRNRVLVTSVAAVLLALVGGLGLTAWQARRARAAERLARERLHSVEEAQADLRAQRDRALAAESEALRSANVSDAVNAYLVDLLGAPNPDFDGRFGRPAGEVRVADVLDDAVRRLDGRFPEEPLVEAELRTTFGNTYLGLSRDDDAARQYERALELLRSSAGPEHALTFEAIARLVACRLRAGRPADAAELCEEGLAVKDRMGADDDFGRLELERGLAQAYAMQGRFDDAEPLYVHAAEGLARRLDPLDWETLDARTGLGDLYLRMRRFDDAATCLERVLSDFERIGHENHPRAMVARNLLTFAYQEQGEPARAEPLYEQLLPYLAETVGRDHPHYLSTLGNLGVARLGTGKLEEAQAAFEELLERSAPEGDGAIAGWNGLGRTYVARGCLDDAETCFDRALAVAEAAVYVDPYYRAKVESNLANLYVRRGRSDEASALLSSTIDRARQSLGPRHPFVPELEEQLAGVLAARGE